MRGGVASPSTEAVPQLALGPAHRRARVFWFWWMGMVFAVPGAVQAIVLAGTGQNPGNGLVLLVLVSLLVVATPRGTSPDVLPILALRFWLPFPCRLEQECCTRGICNSTGTACTPPG